MVYSQTGSGQTLVLLHGFLEDRSMWTEFVSELQHDFNIITPDLLGQGETGNIGYVHSMEEMANAVSEVLNAENINKYTVVGHSMGGYVALALAELNPEKVSGLVLLHSTANADSDERKKDRERVIDLVKRNKAVYIKTVIPSLFADGWRIKLKSGIQALIETAYSYSDQGIIANIRGMMDRKSRSNVLASDEFPSLIIHGELDPIIPTSDIKALANSNENVSLVILAGVGHMGHLEATDKCLKAITSFCKN